MKFSLFPCLNLFSLFSVHWNIMGFYHEEKDIVFSRGYAKRRNDICCGSEYANLSLTQM